MGRLCDFDQPDITHLPEVRPAFFSVLPCSFVVVIVDSSVELSVHNNFQHTTSHKPATQMSTHFQGPTAPYTLPHPPSAHASIRNSTVVVTPASVIMTCRTRAQSPDVSHSQPLFGDSCTRSTRSSSVQRSILYGLFVCSSSRPHPAASIILLSSPWRLSTLDLLPVFIHSPTSSNPRIVLHSLPDSQSKRVRPTVNHHLPAPLCLALGHSPGAHNLCLCPHPLSLCAYAWAYRRYALTE